MEMGLAPEVVVGLFQGQMSLSVMSYLISSSSTAMVVEERGSGNVSLDDDPAITFMLGSWR
jgi:hypothetical protein